MVTTKPKQDRALAPATILIADDEVLIRHDLAERLRAAGFLVVEARNAGEARTLFDAGTPPSILLTDLQMPNPMDGVVLAQHVRLHSPYTKIVLMSGRLADANTSSVADAVFSKPVNIVALLQKLHELTGSRDASEQEFA